MKPDVFNYADYEVLQRENAELKFALKRSDRDCSYCIHATENWMCDLECGGCTRPCRCRDCGTPDDPNSNWEYIGVEVDENDAEVH